MERLSHDLSLALEESNCSKHGRRKFGWRRRTRSTGNIPACLAGVTEDGSSSSPPQAAILSQALTDSDDPQLNQLQQEAVGARLSRLNNIESDSFNEAFSPSKPPNARRKRKFKRMAIEYSDPAANQRPAPVQDNTFLMGPSHLHLVANCSVLSVQGPSQLNLINKKKRIFKHGQDAYRANIFSGKRKWSHRERSEVGEMRERSFSGGCSSKPYFFTKSYLEFKNAKKYLPIDKVPKFKEKFAPPVKSSFVKNGIECALQSMSASKPSLPGSSCFNFVYRCPLPKKDIPDFGKAIGVKIATELPPSFNPADKDGNWPHGVKHKKHGKHNGKKSHHKCGQEQLRNPLQFDDQAGVMDCSVANELLSSSSLSSSDSEGVVTNDSDREGDDELTDWPGNEEISSFTKCLNIKSQRPPMTIPFKAAIATTSKPISKKDKFLPKQGLSSCKKSEPSKPVADSMADVQLMDEDTMMSDSGSVLDTFACSVTRSHSDPTGPHPAFTSFSDVKNAGLLNNNANEVFYNSFQAFNEKEKPINNDDDQFATRTNFSLQKTSSSDLNLSEKSPQSDHCYSEHSLCFGTPEIREIRAGCRRVRDERPGFAILSAANEQLSRFLQDSRQDELKLPCFSHDQEEKEKLASLAKLYSLELRVEMGRPVLKKTSNTTQSVRVEHTRMHHQKILSEFKRRCYGDSPSQGQPSSSAMDPDVCIQSTSTANPYFQAKQASSETSPLQDFDQGFSEPHDIAESPHPEDKSSAGFSGEARPDILSHIPSSSYSMRDSTSIDLGELD